MLIGIVGGLAAIFVVHGLSAASQLKGIAITILIAIITGLISGKIVSLFGKPDKIYDDVNEFEDVEEE